MQQIKSENANKCLMRGLEVLDAAGLKADEGHGGAVTLIQRFGSAANLNIHLRGPLLDGVYRCGAEGVPEFVEVGSPTDDEVHVLLQAIIPRLMKMLTRRGVLVEEAVGRAGAAAEAASHQISRRPGAERELRPLVVPQGPPPQAQAATEAAECEVETVQARPHRIGWARLLKRVFDIDMQHCPNCGARELKIIAAILERPVIKKILSHLGLDPQPPPRGRARQAGQD